MLLSISHPVSKYEYFHRDKYIHKRLIEEERVTRKMRAVKQSSLLRTISWITLGEVGEDQVGKCSGAAAELKVKR